MIRSIRRGSHLTKLSADELEVEARDWAQFYFGIIPEDMLRECHRLAETDPDRRPEDRNFPLRRREVLDAFYRMRAKEVPVKIRECEFCRLHGINPTEYLSCSFHSESALVRT